MKEVPDLHAHQLVMGVAGDRLGGGIHIDILRVLVNINRGRDSFGKRTKQRFTLLKRLGGPFTIGNVAGVDYYLRRAGLVSDEPPEDFESSPRATSVLETNLARYWAVGEPLGLSHEHGCRRNVVGVSELVGV